MKERGDVGGRKPAARSRGRPIDEAIDRVLIESARDEFNERGYHAMSMESIAARAGVSKVSLYRRWTSKSAVVAELFGLMAEDSPTEDHGSLEADIRALLGRLMGSIDSASAGKIVMRTVGEISGDPELLAVYRNRLFAPRIEQMRAIVERARTRGELRAGLPTDIACAMVAGPLFLYYLTLLVGVEVRLSRDPVGQLTRAMCEAISK
jgi:AcrR family transcriptional regulator